MEWSDNLMRQTSNKGYNLVDNSDKIKDSLQAWNTNFEKIDEDITANEENLESTKEELKGSIESISSLADNYTSTKASGTSLNLTDSASAPIDDIKIGDGEIEQDGEPTPSNPVDIKVVEGTTNLVVQSKNIVDWASGTSQYADVTWEDDTLTVSGTGANLTSNFNILNFVKNHPGEKIIFGYESIDFSEFSSSNNTIVQMMITNNGTTSYYTLLSRDSTGSVYTIPDDTSDITLARIRIFANNTNTEETSSITIVKPQLELGEESTEYVEYRNQTYPITLPTGTVLGKIDNASSYIYGDIDDWKLHRGISKIVLNGTEEGWSKTGFTFSNNRIFTGKPKALCSHFTDAGRDWYSDNESYRGKFSTTNSDNQFKCMPLTDMTLEDFKLWLSQNNVTLVYQDVQDDEEITDETLISQLNDIKRSMTTYKGQTIVFTVTDNLHPNIDLTYKINGNIEVNQKVAVVQHQVDMLKSNFDTKTSEQSDDLSITDAINYTAENVKLYGKTEQNQYTGKNLFDKNDVETSYLKDDGTIATTSSANQWRISDYIPISPNTSYITGGMLTDAGASPSRCYYDENKNFLSGVKHSSSNPFINTSPSTAYYMRESCNSSDLNTVQVEAGSTATDYEPYVGGQTSPSTDYPQEIKVVEGECSVQVKNEDNTKSQLATFPLAEGQKLMQGDYLAEDGIHHVRKQVVLDGTESVNVNNQSETIHSFVVKEYASIINRTNITDISCNMLIPKSPDDINTLRITSSGNIVLSFPKDYIDFTISALRNKLQELYNNNTPLIIQFPLLQEEIEPYTPEQQTAWEELQKLETYKGQTRIQTSSEGLAPDSKVTYLVNPLSSIEARLDLLEG